MDRIRKRLDSAHLLAIVAIVLATTGTAGAALVTAKQLANNSVLSKHIKNGQVTTADIGPKAVTNAQLAPGAVKGNNLAVGSIGAPQVADGSLTAADLAPGTIPAVPEFSIANGSIGAPQLADASVTAGKLATGAVTASKLASGSVSTGSIVDGAVTGSKLAAGAVTSASIADGAVTGDDLGTVVGAGVTATNVGVAQDALDLDVATEEADGTVVPFASELFDTDGFWSAGAPTDVVVPSDGVYAIDAWVSWVNDSAGQYREVQVVVDGAIVAQERRPSGSGLIGGRDNQTVSVLAVADAGDVVRLRLSQPSVASLTADRVRLTIRRVGALS